MTDATLQTFRDLAAVLLTGRAGDWQWIGPWSSQRMFGITEARARDYARRFGGEAKAMPVEGSR
jgi:hypothetical protein